MCSAVLTSKLNEASLIFIILRPLTRQPTRVKIPTYIVTIRLFRRQNYNAYRIIDTFYFLETEQACLTMKKIQMKPISCGAVALPNQPMLLLKPLPHP